MNNIIYSDMPYHKENPSIFLAGCTSRQARTAWRLEALEFLKEFNGTIYVPEPFVNFEEQVEWEFAALESCSLITFWIPRNMITFLCLTSNIEFGRYVASGRVLYGRPDDSLNNRYLDWLYTKITGKQPFNTLKGLLNEAIKVIK